MIYLLLIIINLLCGWIYLLKNEEVQEYNTETNISLQDMKTIGIIICLLFGLVLIFRQFLYYGVRYFYYKCKED
jgi:hypothetical protein